MFLRPLSVTVAILGLAATADARSVPLERAAEEGVRVEVVSPSGGYSMVTLTLRNQGEAPVTIAALPGTVLDNRANQEQDLTFSGPVTMSVGPGQSVTREVATFCLNQNLHSPSAGAHFDVSATPNPALAAYIGSQHPDQGAVWQFLSNRGISTEPPPQPAELRCTGPEGGFRICVNTQASAVQPQAQAIAPVPPSITPIPILEMPVPVVTALPQAPVVRRHRPRIRHTAPPAQIGAPDPQINQGVTIEQD